MKDLEGYISRDQNHVRILSSKLKHHLIASIMATIFVTVIIIGSIFLVMPVDEQSLLQDQAKALVAVDDAVSEETPEPVKDTSPPAPPRLDQSELVPSTPMATSTSPPPPCNHDNKKTTDEKSRPTFSFTFTINWWWW